MTESRKTTNVIRFAPDRWGEIEKFASFWHLTYKFDNNTRRAVGGCAGHFHKAGCLCTLAERLVPELEKDERELRETGYSRARRAKEVAALIETVFCELYSCLDCTRQAIGFIFKRLPGITSGSTRKLFRNAQEGKIDERVPELIRTALANAHWYPELRRIRDALTHSDVGSCHRDRDSGMLTYMHEGLGNGARAKVIENVLDKVQETRKSVNAFMGAVFQELNRTLNPDPVRQMCGIFNSLIYARNVSPVDAVDFNSGVCESHAWFDRPDRQTCPFAATCGAYKRAKGIEGQQIDGEGLGSAGAPPSPSS
jgi:hypothetical protein